MLAAAASSHVEMLLFYSEVIYGKYAQKKQEIMTGNTFMLQ